MHLNLTLPILLTAFLAGCDLKFGFPVPTQTQTTASTFSEGFYEATADASTRHYPLLALKKSGTEIHLYQVALLDRPTFGFGSRYTQTSALLATEVIINGAFDFVGSVRVDAKFLRLQSRKFPPVERESSKFPEVGEVLSGQDYALASVTMNKFLTDIRILMNFTSATTFSPTDETNCKTLYNLTCKAAYQDPL